MQSNYIRTYGLYPCGVAFIYKYKLQLMSYKPSTLLIEHMERKMESLYLFENKINSNHEDDTVLMIEDVIDTVLNIFDDEWVGTESPEWIDAMDYVCNFFFCEKKNEDIMDTCHDIVACINMFRCGQIRSPIVVIREILTLITGQKWHCIYCWDEDDDETIIDVLYNTAQLTWAEMRKKVYDVYPMVDIPVNPYN